MSLLLDRRIGTGVLRAALLVGGLLLLTSRETLFEPPDVLWIWSGAVTDRSAVVKARLADGGRRLRLAWSEHASLARARFESGETLDPQGEDRIVTFSLNGLRPQTRYFYAIEIDGRIDRSSQGRFRTFPTGPASFRFAFGSCAATGSEHPVFLTIREEDPLFFASLGDFHYENIGEGDPDAFEDAYDAVLTSRAQSALYRHVPVVYVWDDHDYGRNNSDRRSPSRAAARTAYEHAVPHYPLADGDTPIYQSFRVGRVYFLVTDSRSGRSAADAPDGPGKSLLGERQKRWWKRTLLHAARHHPLVIWLQPTPWIGSGKPGTDPWWSYSTERRELANFIAEHGIRNLLMLSGDAHMAAIDDGRHNRYSDDHRRGFPVFHAGPLDKRASDKGGPFSEGVSLIRGQYGVVEVHDDGHGPVTVHLAGKTAAGETVVSHSFSLPATTRRFAQVERGSTDGD